MNKAFKKYISRILICILCSLMIVLGISIFVVLFPRNVYHESFQSVIQDKYDDLISTDSPKIIIVGGSSACFGINNELLSLETGYPVVNLGLHAGFGALFNTEISKANIGKGDIILLAYEYGWPDEDYFDDFGVDLIMSGIDSNISMYKYIPIRKLPEVIGFVPEYAKNKANYSKDSGIYSRESFDDSANYVLNRDTDDKMQYYDPETWVAVNLKSGDISGKSVKYMKKYKEFVENRGANIYMIGCPLYDRAILNDISVFDELVNNEEKEIGIKYISNPSDYIFSSDYIFDTMYHCNSRGQNLRTELLVEDLKNAGVIHE